MTQLKSDLNKVREWLDDPKRWTQNTMFRKNQREGASSRHNAGCACLMGAIMIVSDGRGRLESAERYDAMEEALRKQLPPEFCTIHKFNDDPETKWVNVVELIDRAINKEK